METALQSLLGLSDLHGERGKELFDACAGELFPCDALGFAVLERSLNLLRGFHLLLSNGGYTPGVGLLRMQLDNVLCKLRLKVPSALRAPAAGYLERVMCS
ncbi:MAG: hypothetical protein ACREV1_03975 [Gammaproteobacteria bacterium]